MSAVLCDGCGQPATSEHIARRLRRLELATRFRPIHIGILFMAEAPPPHMEDYFYYCGEGSAGQSSVRSDLSRILFESLMQGVGISQETGRVYQACLGDFQRGGFFLADAVECPVEEIVPGLGEGTAHADEFELAHRYAPTIVKRLRFSYKPKHIVLLSMRTRHLIPILQQAGLGDRLLLHQGLPLHFPYPDEPAAYAQFRAGLAEVLSVASSRSRSA
jgi:hypothetical protein